MKPHPLQYATFWLIILLFLVLMVHLYSTYRISVRQTAIERHINLPTP
jgi:cbb3-type cytochrome oxidase subunit 3